MRLVALTMGVSAVLTFIKTPCKSVTYNWVQYFFDRNLIWGSLFKNSKVNGGQTKIPTAESLGKLSEALEVSLSELFKADSVESLNTDYKSLIKDFFESQKEALTRLCEKL